MTAEQLQQTIVQGIEEFLDRAQLRMEVAPEKLPFNKAMPREISRRERFARIIERERDDTKGSLEALRLQAKAWRLLTLISLFDPERGGREAKALFMHSFPMVDGEYFRKFIAEREVLAQECGIKSGVFAADVGEKEYTR